MSATPQESDLRRLTERCSRCSLSALCLPGDLAPEELETLDASVQRRRPVRMGEAVFSDGDPHRAVYAVRSGWVKSFRLDRDGNEHVIGFHMPGELFGLDALARGRHACFAEPVTAGAELCELPLDQLDRLCTELPALRRQLMRLMSVDLDTLETFHCGHSADQALAGFLCDLSRRQKLRGLDANRLTLAMTRREIASYLRLTPETVSRVLRRFSQAGSIHVRGRKLTLLDPEQLSVCGRG